MDVSSDNTSGKYAVDKFPIYMKYLVKKFVTNVSRETVRVSVYYRPILPNPLNDKSFGRKLKIAVRHNVRVISDDFISQIHDYDQLPSEILLEQRLLGDLPKVNEQLIVLEIKFRKLILQNSNLYIHQIFSELEHIPKFMEESDLFQIEKLFSWNSESSQVEMHNLAIHTKEPYYM